MPVLRRAIASNTPPKDTSFFRIFDLCMIENWVRHQGNAGPEATAAAPFRAPSIDRHTLYLPGSTGSALSWPCSQNRNQSRFRSLTTSLCLGPNLKIGRASCRARVCPSGYIPVVAVTLKEKRTHDTKSHHKPQPH